MIGDHNGDPKLPGLVMWFGGKGQLLTKIIPLIPYSNVYCEPFGGAASVLLNLKPRPVEVYNDLDGNLINLARVLQNPETAKDLEYRLERTLYSREEFRKALSIIENPSEDNISQAWAFFVTQNQGFSGKAKHEGNWSRNFVSRRNQAINVSKYRNRVARIPEYMKRLARVQIDSIDAVQCIQYWDRPETTFYVDPPYIHETRTSSDDYAYEMGLEAHEKLVQALIEVKGMVVLSCYDHAAYEPLIDDGWQRKFFDVSICAANVKNKGGAPKRVETVFMNPAAWKQYDRQLAFAI